MLDANAERPFKSCPVCNERATTKPRPDLEPHPYVSCSRCGLFYQPHMRAKVFEAHHEVRGDLMSEADRQANRHLARALYHNHLARRYAGHEVFHLDIGSKYPFFGHCLQAIASENGTRLTSHGIDGIPEAREFGRQLEVLMAVGDFEAGPQTWDMPAAMGEHIAHSGFHCVSLIHCLEHFYSPLRTLRTIRGLMANGGILFIRSPDSRAPGIERDFTPGHYDIHPTIWCKDAMFEALARLQDAFVVYETYEIAHQRDYLLQAIERKPTIGVGLVVQNDDESIGTATESVATEAALAPRKALEYAPRDETWKTWMRERTPHVINILRPGAIGDVLASSAVTAQLAELNPDFEIRYYTKTPHMAKLLVGVHKVYDSDQWPERAAGTDFNLIGYPLAEGYPERPMRKPLTAYFCDEARLPPGPPRLKEEFEPFDIDRSWITIHPKSGWSVYKDWALENWNEIVRRIRQCYPETAIVQIGVGNDPPLNDIDYDLRGSTSISQALWLVKNSVLHLGVDSFTNHAAGAFRHPAVIVFGSTSPTGSGYDTAINLWAGLSCSPCYREDPQISRQDRGPCVNPPGQDYNQPRHACMAAITVETVWRSIETVIAGMDRRMTPMVRVPSSSATSIPDKEFYRPIFSPWEGFGEFPMFFGRAGGKTLVSPDRCYMLYSLARQALSVRGDFWECGVYKGGTAAMLAEIIFRLAPEAAIPRHQLRLFDTFSGMPDTDPQRDLHQRGDFSDVSLNEVRGVVGQNEIVSYHQGLIPQTFEGLEHSQIAFAHIDVDIYQSVFDCCRFIFPRLAFGGFMVFDDYGFSSCPGARSAVDEYFKGGQVYPLVLPTGQALVFKGG